MPNFKLTIGANWNGNSTRFKVWAPNKKIHIVQGDKEIEMELSDNGYLEKELPDAIPTSKYKLKIDNGLTLPDPVSRFLPDGLSGETEIINPNDFKWEDDKWKGLKLEDLIIYELHVGTFSKNGNYDEVNKKIPFISYVGYTCAELMPLAQFQGKRGWGYDGINLFSPFNLYGRPNDLKGLINNLHKNEIASGLDIVLNHIGPGGEKFFEPFGPYLTERFGTPWGKSFDFSLPAVREHIISNILYWASEYHIDVFRIDASEFVCDDSEKHILLEIREELDKLSRQLGRKIILIDEDFTNSLKNLKEFKHDAEWVSDPGQALIKALEPDERTGWLIDFNGVKDLGDTLVDPHHVHNGFRWSTRNKKRGLDERFGASAKGISGKHFVISDQNHDIIGNRPCGDRNSKRLNFDKLKLSTAVKLLSRYIPMTFMGQEFGSTSPFNFFTDHNDQFFIDSVRNGRNNEYNIERFNAEEISQGVDPNSEEAFLNSKLGWEEASQKINKGLLRWHEELIAFRKRCLIPDVFDERNITVHSNPKDKWIAIRYTLKDDKVLGLFFNFSPNNLDIKIPFPENVVTVEFDSRDKDYFGTENSTRGKNINNRVRMSSECTIVGWLGKGQEELQEEPTHNEPHNTDQPTDKPDSSEILVTTETLEMTAV